MNHESFIQKLEALGFKIEVFAYEHAHFVLHVNSFVVSASDYEYFGYYCGGTYAPCSRTEKKEFNESDLHAAIKKCSEILMKQYEMKYNDIDYHDCLDFLKGYGKTKIEKESIVRVINILKDNFQYIIREKKKFTRQLSRYNR